MESIAHYRITAKIGEGGMGAVYRATDTKLNRDVAIKMLPESFARDADRLARCQREAQVLASLNHPNIAAIYGIEQGALVMELVEGDDLHGPVPIDTALDYARQIATGLEAAHEKGIIHRDLKPANIKVTPEGVVKLLDFGLAKAADEPPAGAVQNATISPTLSMGTQVGVILGTAAYMSTEQARGKAVDKRADIWAFGVVVFELLTGRHLYGGGEDVSDTLAAVLTRDVDWKALPTDVPPRLLALLRDCLVRDPKQRLRDIGDARRVLDQIIAGLPDPAAGIAAAQSEPRPSRARALPWSVAAVALAGAAALTSVHFRETPPAQQTVRFQISAPEKSPVAAFALSPDGRYLAFATGYPFAGTRGGTRLWLRPIDSLDAHALPGTEGISV